MNVVELDLDAIAITERFRVDLGDLDDLAASIESLGLLHPVVVAADGNGGLRLVAGQRRIEAVRMLGWVSVPARIVPLSPDEWVQAEHDENELRKSFTVSERVAIAGALRPAAEEAAKERQRESGERHGRGIGRDDSSPPIAEPRVRDQVAGAVGWSGQTLDRATTVVEAAKADNTLAPVVEAMDRGDLSVAEAHRQVNNYLNSDGFLDRETRRKKVRAVFTSILNLPLAHPAASLHEFDDDGLWVSLDHAIETLTTYRSDAQAARPTLRAIEGGRTT